MISPPMLLGGFAVTASALLLAVISSRPRMNMTEEEIVEALKRSWMGQSDRKALERRLAALQASRPATAQPAPAETRVTPERRGEPQAGAVEIKKGDNGHFYATCSIVAGKTFKALWDTGATTCHLSHEVVRDHLGIRNPKKELRHDHNSILGDGRTKLACATQNIDWLVEGILVPDVATSITLDGGNSNIVGQSLINQLRLKQSGGRLLIYPPRT